ncbi:hypothetical protein, partial [Undibacterium luofuense]|uniref:hypothetical protein n=1 Tax=Undibacterium luofuense TaxID=2828733 RepID=UPI001BAFA192
MDAARQVYFVAAGFATSALTSGFTSAPPSACFFAFFTFFGFASVLASAAFVSVAAGVATGFGSAFALA